MKLCIFYDSIVDAFENKIAGVYNVYSFDFEMCVREDGSLHILLYALNFLYMQPICTNVRTYMRAGHFRTGACPLVINLCTEGPCIAQSCFRFFNWM